MKFITERFRVLYEDETVGTWYRYSDGSESYEPASGLPEQIGTAVKELGLDRPRSGKRPIGRFRALMKQENRVPGTRQIICRAGPLTLKREPEETEERFSVYRRAAIEGESDYSPLPHDARHDEGPHTPEGMREWANWYAFVRMDDGTYQAALDEAWYWGGSHFDGGTIRRQIPEEWFALPYEAFLRRVVGLSAAAHYGFTAEMLEQKAGLKAFFGFA